MNKQQYAEYLKSADWKAKKKRKYAKCNHRCAVCGATERLDVHHMNYRQIYDVKNTDLRILCRECHSAIHRVIKSGKLALGREYITYKEFLQRSHHSQFAIMKTSIRLECNLDGCADRRKESLAKYHKHMAMMNKGKMTKEEKRSKRRAFKLNKKQQGERIKELTDALEDMALQFGCRYRKGKYAYLNTGCLSAV